MNMSANSVVVGVDGSSDSNRALDWAAQAAASHEVGIHLIYSLPQLSYDMPYWHAEDERHVEFADELLMRARTRVEAPGRPVTWQAVDEPAARALIDASKKASMVVVGAHGHGALGGALFGSVSQHVSRHAACPVVVVREPADSRSDRIVVGVDGSPHSDKAIAFAFDHAARTGAPLTAINAWRDRVNDMEVVHSYDSLTSVAQRVEEGNRLLAESLAGWAEKYPEVSVTREAIPVHPARALTDASDRAALVVVGSRGRGEFAGLLLGSVSQAVLHHARTSIVIVR